MKSGERTKRFHSKVWVTWLCLTLLLCSSLTGAGESAKPVPDEIKNLTTEQIFTPDPKIETIYPLKARQDGVNAEVWLKYKFSGEKPDSIIVIYCSKDGYDLEKAAVMSLREHDFSRDSATVKLEIKWLYTKVIFGYGVSVPTVKTPIDSEQMAEVMPELIKKVAPSYPRKARNEGIEATVYVRVLVGKDGKPLDARIVKSTDYDNGYGFNDAVLRAVVQCRFKPGIQNGKPANTWVTFPYEFRLR